MTTARSVTSASTSNTDVPGGDDVGGRTDGVAATRLEQAHPVCLVLADETNAVVNKLRNMKLVMSDETPAMPPKLFTFLNRT